MMEPTQFTRHNRVYDYHTCSDHTCIMTYLAKIIIFYTIANIHDHEKYSIYDQSLTS